MSEHKKCVLHWPNNVGGCWACHDFWKKPEAPTDAELYATQKIKPAKAQAPREWIITHRNNEYSVDPKEPDKETTGSVRVIEYAAYSALERELRDAKRALADYEHECETIQEMKRQLTQARAELAEAKRDLSAHAEVCAQYSELVELRTKSAALVELLSGCSDGNCILRDRDGGQRTNGGCRCKRNIREALKKYGGGE